QGTGVVAVAAILAATRRTNVPLQEQRIIIFGAGTAGMGIAELIHKMLVRMGMTDADANRCFWLLDSSGLISDHVADSHPNHTQYLRSADELADWDIENLQHIELFDVVRHVKPTVLIGSSTVQGAFNEAIIKEMAKHVEQPIIFPLSNPTERSEATPADLLKWTNGNALIATGSPFDPVDYDGNTIVISQCNNFLAFPGLGLGILAVNATSVCDNMLWAASEALSEYTKFQPHTLLPTISQATDASRQVAIAVAKAAIKAGLAEKDPNLSVEQRVDNTRWEPHYLPYRLVD
ncbi:MAG: NAD-dependent malic enzyme, partial [Coxiella sp. (in: Bacteria)]